MVEAVLIFLLQFQLEVITLEDRNVLPIRFYDCPGIDEDEDEIMNIDVLEAVIKGHVRGDSQVLRTNRKNYPITASILIYDIK